MAVRLDTPFAAIADRVGTIIKDVSSVISFGIGRTNEERVEHELFDDAEAWTASDMESYRQKAAGPPGTLRPRKHYPDFLRGAEGPVRDRGHFGSPRPRHTSRAPGLQNA